MRRFNPSKRTPTLNADLSDSRLGMAGVALAAASTAFALHMISNSDRTPEINGIEHLAIYSRPTRPVRAASNDIAISRANKRSDAPEIDYTPVGAIQARSSQFSLSTLTVVKANAAHVSVRLPDGKVAEFDKGDIIAGAGRILEISSIDGRWAVTTEKGEILEPMPRENAPKYKKAPTSKAEP